MRACPHNIREAPSRGGEEKSDERVTGKERAHGCDDEEKIKRGNEGIKAGGLMMEKQRVGK